MRFLFLCRAAATGPAYPAQQSGYAVAQTTAYGAQRPAGFDPAAYQTAAAPQGTYAGESNWNLLFQMNRKEFVAYSCLLASAMKYAKKNMYSPSECVSLLNVTATAIVDTMGLNCYKK